MILGIDTSNYTTSVAVVSKEQQLLFDERIILDVKKGERGLQQSAAVFQHINNLPELLEKALNLYRDEIAGICFSKKPRPLKDSYMPVFKVGQSFAKTLSLSLNIPLAETTHQESHLAAGLWSSGFSTSKKFLTMHLSGGTTDLLLVEPCNGGFKISLLGSSLDLHAGQFVDRIGVKLGLKFPTGPSLEKLAVEADKKEIVLPSAVHGYMISFSGPCSAAERYIESGIEHSTVAFSVFRCIANSIIKILDKAITETGIRDILFVGGVASNGLIKERLLHRLSHKSKGAKLHFAQPQYCRDNAIGTALLGNELLKK